MQSKNLCNQKSIVHSNFDFSTLYTNIPHNTLKDVIRELIDFRFQGGEKLFIGVTKFGAKWTDNNTSR